MIDSQETNFGSHALSQTSPRVPVFPLFDWKALFLLVVRWGFGILFLVSATSKIVNPDDFAAHVDQYELGTAQLQAWVSTILPWMEFVLGIFLIGRVCIAGAFLATSLLFVAFGFVHASILHRGLSVDCGCGLMHDDPVTWVTLLRSIIFMLISSVAYAISLASRTSQFPLSSAKANSLSNTAIPMGPDEVEVNHD